MDSGTEAIYQELLLVAKGSNLTNYSDIAPLAGLDMGLPPDRNSMASILDEISRSEHENGRPLLSAVVVLKGENIPGEGFFSLAKDLRLHDGSDDVVFWVREVQRVHNYWSKQG